MIFNKHVLHEHIRITAVVQVTPCNKISITPVLELLNNQWVPWNRFGICKSLKIRDLEDSGFFLNQDGSQDGKTTQLCKRMLQGTRS
jgi:hypothetical protein